MNQTPEFLAAVERHEAMQATLGEDHPLTQRAFALVWELAPHELKTIMTAQAREMGLIPEHPDGYLDSGEPVYNLHSIARQMGMTEAEAQESLQAFLADRAALGLDCPLVDPTDVHIIQ